MSKPERRGDDASVIPFEVAGAAAVVIGATILTGALFDASQAAARLMVVAVAVGGCAALVRRTWAAIAGAALGYLLLTAYPVTSNGGPGWDGATSLWHLLVLGLVTAVGLGQRWIRAAQADVLFDMGLQSLLDEAEPNGNDDWRRRP